MLSTFIVCAGYHTVWLNNKISRYTYGFLFDVDVGTFRKRTTRIFKILFPVRLGGTGAYEVLRVYIDSVQHVYVCGLALFLFGCSY